MQLRLGSLDLFVNARENNELTGGWCPVDRLKVQGPLKACH